jgi:hypothetical protein
LRQQDEETRSINAIGQWTCLLNAGFTVVVRKGFHLMGEAPIQLATFFFGKESGTKKNFPKSNPR